MHKLVDGELVPLTDNEVAEVAARAAEWEAGQAERTALGLIADLEKSITDRMWREDARGASAVMNFGPEDARTGKTASQYIAWVDDQIAGIRGQLAAGT